VLAALGTLVVVIEKVAAASPGNTSAFGDVMEELGAAAQNLRQYLPGNSSRASENRVSDGMQVNATIGGSRPDGRILTEAVGNEAKSGMQINAPIYGDISFLPQIASLWGQGSKG